MKKAFLEPLKVVEKSMDAKLRILDAIKPNILFQSLDDTQRSQVVDAMEKKIVTASPDIITVGEEGDNFYVLEKGAADVYVPKLGPDPILTYKPGNSFGELALMYNTPRAATVKATADCVLWALDRSSFRRLLISTLMEKRQKHEAFLAKVPILSSMSHSEQSMVVECLVESNHDGGSTIITQGEPGNHFYIVESGSLIAKMNQGPGTADVEVATYGSGDYFGELALIADKPRAASIIATSDCKLLSLERKTFTRVLGPIDEMLKRNAEQYKKYEDAIRDKAANEGDLSDSEAPAQ
jgi:cAMP-dependent protein kinase regulator